MQISGIGSFEPRDVARLVKDSGLVIAATHMSWERFLNDLDEVIETHKLWNCRHAAIGSLPHQYYNQDGLNRFVEEQIPVAETLLKAGMDFSYHNHNQELVKYGDKAWLEMLYDNTSPRHLKAEIDTYWIQAGGGYPYIWIKKCAGSEPLLHLKDMAVTPDRQQRFAEIGKGNLHWPSILQAAADGSVNDGVRLIR